ncbi:hypothetical protein [Anaeromicropila populeti]|uniref:Carbohydrate/starch-binding module (Family 21) n=1 Tax=Anaeromicropila populeti TaxID=37658 RepID=A0A1I6JH42_9FIRM|nr:hypothetical protein [Anaeromicropila populeti]SFR78281.1 Carbohydrate/starch-binding module (family 21) [Anaeromicropila populeti]
MKALKIDSTFTSFSDYNGLGSYSKSITAISQYPATYPVFIYYRNGSVWNTVAMTLKYATKVGCIWEYHDTVGIGGYKPTSPGVLPIDTDFALYQDTPSGRIWDNNFWKNYHLGSCDGPYLGQNVGISLWNAFYSQDNTFGGNIIVSNIAYEKEVTVYYKEDNMSAYSSCSAFFSQFTQVGVHQTLISPTVNNCDMFSFSTELKDCETIEFYLTYEVSGQFFIDNNRGQNYIVKK